MAGESFVTFSIASLCGSESCPFPMPFGSSTLVDLLTVSRFERPCLDTLSCSPGPYPDDVSKRGVFLLSLVRLVVSRGSGVTSGDSDCSTLGMRLAGFGTPVLGCAYSFLGEASTGSWALRS